MRHSSKTLERPWVIPWHSDGSLPSSLSSLVFLSFNLVLCWYHIATFFPFQFPSPISYAIILLYEKFLFWEADQNYLTISMPPFWYVKCLQPIHLHLFLQFLLFALAAHFLYHLPFSFIWDFPFLFTKCCHYLFQWPREALILTLMIVSCSFIFKYK